MARLTTRSTVLRLRKWVDAALSKPDAPRQGYALLPGYLALTPPLLLEYVTGGAAPDALWVIPIFLCVAWVAFVLWRAARMTRAAAIKGDRDYDRRGKYLLPPEYADGESPTAARSRKRLARRR